MKIMIYLALLIILQPSISFSKTKIGIGISNEKAIYRINENSNMPFATYLYFPIKINNIIKIEPQFSHGRYKADVNLGFSTEQKINVYSIGAAICFNRRKSNISYNIGLKYVFNSIRLTANVSNNLKDNADLTENIISPLMGVEYHFNGHISFGGDVAYKNIWGDHHYENGVDNTYNLMDTIFYIRLYL